MKLKVLFNDVLALEKNRATYPTLFAGFVLFVCAFLPAADFLGPITPIQFSYEEYLNYFEFENVLGLILYLGPNLIGLLLTGISFCILFNKKKTLMVLSISHILFTLIFGLVYSYAIIYVSLSEGHADKAVELTVIILSSVIIALFFLSIFSRSARGVMTFRAQWCGTGLCVIFYATLLEELGLHIFTYGFYLMLIASVVLCGAGIYNETRHRRLHKHAELAQT